MSSIIYKRQPIVRLLDKSIIGIKIAHLNNNVL